MKEIVCGESYRKYYGKKFAFDQFSRDDAEGTGVITANEFDTSILRLRADQAIPERDVKLGRRALVIHGESEPFYAARSVPKQGSGSGLEATFRQLSDAWKAQTKLMSSMQEIVMNSSYQRIIGLGPNVIPLVLKELEDNGGHWFWALRSLTGEDPVAVSDRGRFGRMRDAWLTWGRRNGYR